MSFMRQSSNGNLGDVLPTLKDVKDFNQVGKVLITSGSGVIGYRVAVSLLEAGHKDVRVGIWKEGDRADESCGPQCAEVLRQKGAQVIDFDWSHDEGFNDALKDVKTVFCTIPHIEGWQDVFPKFIRKCMYKNVQHFVKVSFLTKLYSEAGYQYHSNVQYCKFHGSCDDLLFRTARSDDNPMSCTILACSHLMSTPLFSQGDLLRKQHQFVTASFGMGVNYLSPNDVADAAVVCILRPQTHCNRVYNLTGPAPITDEQVAELLSEHYGHPIQHIPLTYHDYVANVKKRRLPAWQVRDCAAFEKIKASGVDELPSSYTHDLETITGNKPESFRDFLNNQSCMRPGMSFP